MQIAVRPLKWAMPSETISVLCPICTSFFFTTPPVMILIFVPEYGSHTPTVLSWLAENTHSCIPSTQRPEIGPCVCALTRLINSPG
eukprot:1574347-Rhodomonas_salina.1